MLLTPHTIIALYLILNFNPALALPASFVSHFLFDFFFPHWNPHLFTEMKENGKLSWNTLKVIFGDALLALGLTLFFAFKKLPNYQEAFFILIAAFLAILPDIIEIPYYFLKSKNGILKKIINFEHLHQAKANKFWGSFSQIVLIIICLWAILK
ncbi:hypothetical protein GYA19_02095 [Candidatus Beckwithbacteria bacterium]|nr:hypothetical protein [Candidatus Beckwithbacteria bacterium]